MMRWGWFVVRVAAWVLAATWAGLPGVVLMLAGMVLGILAVVLPEQRP